MNNVSIIGRITAVPELRHTPAGKAVADGNLAVDDGFGDQKKSFFFNVTFWGATAENLVKHVVKGQQISIVGRLSQEEYTPAGQDKPVRKTRIICEKMGFLAKPQGATGEPRQQQQAAPKSQPAQGATAAPADDFQEDDDVPF
jgi:single-strand DNA-binding protein